MRSTSKHFDSSQQPKSATPYSNQHLQLERKSRTRINQNNSINETHNPSQASFDLGTIPIFSSSQRTIQPKLKINAPGDRYEQEADHMADRVVRMPNMGLETQHRKEQLIQRSTLAAQISPVIQRKCSKCEEEEKQTVQTKSVGQTPQTASRSMYSRIQNTQGHGQAMDRNTNAFMSSRFGTDFSGVRIHTGSAAAQMNQEINAKAFTIGKHVYFNRGKYSPGSSEGKRLLAHELTHVVQQNGRQNSIQRSICIKGQDGFSFQDLHGYLTMTTIRQEIENNDDSDDKARAIVKCWQKLDNNFILSPFQKVLLIKEMQSGPTGVEDERAILALLEGSDNTALWEMFGTNGLDRASLNYDLDDAENDRLNRFFNKRFSSHNNRLYPKGIPTKFSNCDENLKRNIKRNLPIARRKLTTAIDILGKSHTSEFVKNALYLYFRSSSEITKTYVKFKLKNVANQFEKMNFECHKDHNEDCDGKTLAYVEGHQNPVHICNKDYLKSSDHNLTIIHEAFHLFNPEIIDHGYHKENCQESVVGESRKPSAGDPPAERLRNADSYACLISQLTHADLRGEDADAFQTDVRERADAFRGVGLNIEREKFGSDRVNLYPDGIDLRREFSFKVENVPTASGFVFRWRLNLNNDPNNSIKLNSTDNTAFLLSHRNRLIKDNIQKATLECFVSLYRTGWPKRLSKELTFDHSKAKKAE